MQNPSNDDGPAPGSLHAADPPLQNGQHATWVCQSLSELHIFSSVNVALRLWYLSCSLRLFFSNIRSNLLVPEMGQPQLAACLLFMLSA